jgi:hypothetical protein
MEEAFKGCRDHREQQKREDDPVRNAHLLLAMHICNAHVAN